MSQFFTQRDIGLSLFALSIMVVRILEDIEENRRNPPLPSNTSVSKGKKIKKSNSKKLDDDGHGIDYDSFDVDKWVKSMTELPIGSAREKAERDASLAVRDDFYECIIIGAGLR